MGSDYIDYRPNNIATTRPRNRTTKYNSFMSPSICLPLLSFMIFFLIDSKKSKQLVFDEGAKGTTTA
jgi:hypothetical protein